MSDTAPAEPAQPSPAPARPRLRAWLVGYAYPLLAALCLLLWLPGVLSLPALDRDESRFAQSSRQMLESGNFVDIRFGQEPRYKKPVGIYWAQAIATAVAGHAINFQDGDDHHIWTYRLPSLLGGVAAVWLTFWVGSAFGAEAGLLAALLLGFSVLLTAEATIATTDAVLLAATLAMQGVLLRIYRAAAEGGAVPRRTILWGWVALALGILTKGPVIAGVAAATIAALLIWDWRGKTGVTWHWLKATRPLLGLPLAVVIVAPWLIAIWLQSHGAFFEQSLGQDFAAKLAGGQESHGAPPGYNLVLSTIAFWPAILFLLPALAAGIVRSKEPAIRFLLAWAGGFWLICELVPTKLPQYVLPAYPALAVLTALWLLAPKEVVTGWRRILPFIAALQYLVGLIGLAAAPVWLPRLYGGGDGMALIVYALVAALTGLGALVMLMTGARLIALALALASLLILVPTLAMGTGPRLTQLWTSERLAALAVKDQEPGDPSPSLAGFEEPSLVFALGADVTLTDGQGAAQQGADEGGLALVDDHERPAFLARLAELQSDATPVDEVTGFNYSRGKKVHVTVYRVRKLIYETPPAHVTTRIH